jgi:hypothetical protein
MFLIPKNTNSFLLLSARGANKNRNISKELLGWCKDRKNEKPMFGRKQNRGI